MLCLLTHRRIKPGSFDEFRQVWEGDGPPPFPGRAYHVRSVSNPDEVISFGLFDADPADFERLRQEMGGEGEARRQEAMAQFVEWTGVDGVFEVIEEVTW